ncbi:oligosaccharide flippase family protein [Pseudobacteriovorax antillogorgiicola]|uniref:Membrane protein involved in the export of O-antigen and teichoic acid n=1 Tax=Pseudobacteriovorax antillogorgiicola TaxID=1513793 RepID=A0A1Y6BKU5_9BACT|nr:oligosaccharide flippase family protein [Pseudobacteriovorax antillogorgiicola]TCS55389.1 O-antigen/teichoic acid export membrane protein [Pseudobacteriovorax antillogorgiicola]SMF13145.1 Membrane protein involved in the export of O-antigen and teichoic acid [Pseudobacteriovorax antillogorgiicola]
MANLYNKTAKNLVKLGVSLGLTMCLGALVRALLPRILGVEGVGVLYFAESIAGIIFTLTPLGVHAYINRTIPQDPGKIVTIFPSLSFMTFLTGGLLWLGLFSYGTWQGLEDKFLIVVVFGLFEWLRQHTQEVVKPMFLAADYVNFVSRLDVFAKVVQALLVCVGVWLFPDVLWAAGFFLFSQIITLTILLVRALQLGWLRLSFDWQVCKAAAIFGLPFLLNQALVSLYGQIDIAVLEILSDETEIGWYGSAQRLKGLFLMGVPLLYSAVIPMLSKSRAAGENAYFEFFYLVYRVLMLVSWLMAMAMILLGQEFVELLYGAEFEPATIHVQLLAPVLLFTYINVFLSANLGLISDGRKLTLITFVSLMANTGLNFLLIPYFLGEFGEGGAGIGATLTTIIAELMVFLAMLRITPIQIMSRNVSIITAFSLMTIVLVSTGIWFLEPQWYVRLLLFAFLAGTVTIGIGLQYGRNIKQMWS